MNDDVISLKQLTVFSIGGDWGQSPDEKIDGYTKVKVIRGTEFASWSKNKGKTAALRQIKNSSLEKRKLKSGDLVVEVSGGGPKQPVGRVIRIDDEAINNSELPLVCSNFFRLLRVNDEYSSEYARLSILRDYLNGKVNLYQTSSTNLRNLNFTDFLENIEITKLPKKIQEEKVKLLTVVNSSLENSSLNLLRAKDIIKKFRQSILSAAVTGKLTKDWRSANVQSKQSLLTTFANNYEDLPDIPSTWSWVVLGDMANIRGGVTKGRVLGNKKVISLPYLRVANVQDGYLDLSEIKEIEIPVEEEEKYLLQVGDILFTEGGDRDKLGRGAIWNGEIKNCIHQNHIFRARITSQVVVPEYISLVTKSSYAKDYFFGNASQTVNLASINLTTLKNTPITLPPFEEQRVIVEKVLQYFELADKVETQIANAEAKVSKLTQAVLGKVFSHNI